MSTQTYGTSLAQVTRFGIMNSYLVREADGLTAIDTGMGGSAPAILAAAEAMGAPIVRIILTHAHTDHVGSVDALARAVPTATLAISAREARLLSGDMALNTGEDQAKIRGGFQKLATRPSLLLNDGDMIGSLRAVAAPGHTPGHMAFFDERNGALIAGDAFQTLGGVAVAGVLRPLFPLPALATWSLPTALETARKLRALNPRLLAIGHGRMLEGPLAAIDAAIATAEDKARGMATRGA